MPISIRCAIATAFTLLAMTAAGATSAATPAQTDELKTIVNDLMLPAAKDLTDALSLSQSDQPKACELANKAASEIKEAGTRYSALYPAMAASSEDTTKLTDLKTKIDAMVPQAQEEARSICAGEITDANKDPALAAIVKKITDYVSAYAASETAAMHAEDAGDTKTYCASSRDSQATLTAMSDYITNLRQQALASGGNTASFDNVLAQNKDRLDSLNKRLETCPAA